MFDVFLNFSQFFLKKGKSGLYQIKVTPRDTREIASWNYDFELTNPNEFKEKSQILENSIQKLKSDANR
jgi:hypothetical protein